MPKDEWGLNLGLWKSSCFVREAERKILDCERNRPQKLRSNLIRYKNTTHHCLGAGGENATLNKGPGGTAWTSRSHHATESSMSLWGAGDAIVTISSDEEEGNRGEKESSGEPRKRRGLNNSRRPLPYIQHSGFNSNPVQGSKPYSHNPSVHPKTSQHRQNARQTVEHEMEHPLYGLHNVGGTESASALSAGCGFVTARTQLAIDMAKKGQAYPSGGGVGGAGGVGSRSLKRQAPPAVPNGGAGVAGGGNCVSRAFTPPSFVQKALNGPPHQGTAGRRPAAGRGGGGAGGGSCGEELNGGQFSERVLELLSGPDGEIPEEIMKLDPKIVEQVSNEILDSSAGDIQWDDIAGQDAAKRLVQEIVVWPMLNPQLFTGARAPPRGLLLFGPPGTGKTLIGKAIASNIKVKALFTIARCLQPSVIFIDEIDSILSARKAEGEHESSRRLKTEMLVQMEGCDPKSSGCRVLLIGATNRPEELDDAARRRLPKQLYIPLPCPLAREQMVLRMLRGVGHCLSAAEVSKVVAKTEGYSGSDMRNFVQEACQGPVRDALRSGRDVGGMQEQDLRPVNLKDFQMAQRAQKKSVDDGEVVRYEEYNEKHGAKYADQCVSGNDASCMEDW
ncbi:hypothetical protein CEUSTIGMA_g9818.t1 [Chlamydomonas eustigma]|uniref:AAA+ ATPase domain-containing protein n=1 Tax=Chlamydomonas eustigma TaxID=1157962 RepID=A0A250XHW3_9CHLO|nr:hypothetical protein CEUSTIGMA_g9818.t1 [Chlamydomonas eustigma]|eukprot:GAX82390.1 hypothetical protein CEUSTIGMA_g9818.t1 [Chlamydomonas eustigma]